MDYTTDFFNVLHSHQRRPNDDGKDNRERSCFEALWCKNYDDEEDDNNRWGQWNSRGDPPISGQ